MKGILLAGGSGTRLHPLTISMSKQLLPVYDKPVIYYPLSNLMFAGIRDILIISTPRDVPMIQGLLGDGSSLGLNLRYAEQKEPKGIAEAFLIGKDFIGESPVCLILGDNVFFGHELPNQLEQAADLTDGACVFGYRVADPERFAVAELDSKQNVISLEEKPRKPKSNWAVTGIYFYDKRVVSIAENLIPSGRGELEITDVNLAYLNQNQLKIQLMGRGIAWLDAGTPDSLLTASTFVQTIEQRQAMKIGCIEEIAYRKNFISKTDLENLAEKCPQAEYRGYLSRLLDDFA